MRQTTGPGSSRRRGELFAALMGRASDAERDFLRRLVPGEMRHGALEGVMMEAAAKASGLASRAVRRAYFVTGSLGHVAAVALSHGEAGLDGLQLTQGRPILPALAQPCDDIAEAFRQLGAAALEYKMARARVQVHKVGSEVAVFTGGLRDGAAARDFFAAAVAAGHEGVMAKTLDGVYEAGERSRNWLKVKRVHTLDPVVLAAEWGHGRRRGWLSNLHLGVRDPADGSFVMLGKTFKGLTDAMLMEQTEWLQRLETARDRHTVYVRPEVVEVAFNDLQASPQYPAGLALRFARVKRYRPDKRAEQADTLESVRAIYDAANAE